MKVHIKIFLLLLVFTVGLVSCKEDEIDVNRSIFDTTEENLAGFDKWLDDNYRVTYNIKFCYKYEDMETDMNYNLIPARFDKSVQMARLIKFVWLEAYAEAVSLSFIRTYSPRLLYLVGSPAWKTSSKTVGTAESGLKVTLYGINDLDPTDINTLTATYFETMHHEFMHILHQTKMYDLTFREWSAEYYVGSSWSDKSEQDMAKLGFVSAYSCKDANEDFVEVIALYLTQTDEWWELKEIQAEEEGWALILKKIEFVRDYLKDYWEIDLDGLREVVRRRAEEAAYLDLSTDF